MKKLTASVAKRLSTNSTRTVPKIFQDVVTFIVSEARNGHTNTFIDGKLKDLEIIKIELEERGFKCYIESVADGPKFLSVEW